MKALTCGLGIRYSFTDWISLFFFSPSLTFLAEFLAEMTYLRISKRREEQQSFHGLWCNKLVMTEEY